jgi:soluble P-type ATPase
MLQLNIPGRGNYTLEHLVLDYNGTIALDGKPLPDVAVRMEKISEMLQVHVLTADTFGTVEEALSGFPCKVAVIRAGDREDEEKLAYISGLGLERSVAIGNGANDRLMLAHAAIGICVVQHEGASMKAVEQADILCRSITDALDLLIYPARLIATLRGCNLTQKWKNVAL